LDDEKVGERWKGKAEGFGKWLEPADLPTPHNIDENNVSDHIIFLSLYTL